LSVNSCLTAILASSGVRLIGGVRLVAALIGYPTIESINPPQAKRPSLPEKGLSATLTSRRGVVGGSESSGEHLFGALEAGPGVVVGPLASRQRGGRAIEASVSWVAKLCADIWISFLEPVGESRPTEAKTRTWCGVADAESVQFPLLQKMFLG
jgi:hypothetical protein